MRIEYIIIIIVIIISAILILLIPKDKRRIALIAFLILQTVTWVAAILVNFYDIIDFPVRVFYKATKVSVIFEFMFYPTIFACFYLLYSDNKNKFIKGLYYFIAVSIIVWFIFLTGKYTDLHKPTEVKGYKEVLRLYISFYIEFLISLIYLNWFLKKDMPKEGVT